MATPARDRLLPATQTRRAAGRNTVARRIHWVRPVGPALVRVTRDHCTLQGLAAFSDTFAPGAQVTGVNAFGLSGMTLFGRPAPGLAGASSLSFFEEEFTVDDLRIVEQVIECVGGGITSIFLFGYGFREDPLDDFLVVSPESTDRVVIEDPFASLGPVTFVPDPSVEGFTVGPNIKVVKADLTVEEEHKAWPCFTDGRMAEAYLHYSVVRA